MLDIVRCAELAAVHWRAHSTWTTALHAVLPESLLGLVSCWRQ